jgi:phage head maturation protease
MAVDAQGVTFEFEAPRCDIGDRCLEMVRRGDYSGCSFEFYPKDYEVERTKGSDGKDEVIIRHKSFEFLSALTIGMDPAYKQTSVNVREVLGKKTEKTDEELKREQQQREQDEREKELRVMRAYERRSRELQIASFRMKSNY